MMELLGALVIILVIIIIFLLGKIHYFQMAAKEIVDGFKEKLVTDTNTLISISSQDIYMRQLAGEINCQLRILRKQQLKYQNGDKELKDAVTNISHDLRTPLTAICGYMDLLQKEEKSENVSRYLYINGVLEESIAGFYGALTERGITPIIHLSEQRIERLANKGALSRVFSNILNNVLKYSDGDLEIELRENGTILFSNTAKTLDEVQVGKLFDRFYTVEAARNSNGLGLAIAKTLVEKMRGRIEAHYVNSKLIIEIAFLI